MGVTAEDPRGGDSLIQAGTRIWAIGESPGCQAWPQFPYLYNGNCDRAALEELCGALGLMPGTAESFPEVPSIALATVRALTHHHHPQKQ